MMNNVKKCLQEGVIVPAALYGAEACGVQEVLSEKMFFHFHVRS